MADIVIEQALYGNPEAGGFRFLARSAGFREDWLPLAERRRSGFGERPAGVACPECLFAQPFGPDHVVVAQVADMGSDDAGRPGALGFRLLVLSRPAYTDIGGDPFLVAERFAPSWQERGTLPALTWPAAPLPPRTVVQIQQVLKGADSATLLGGAQALIDSGRLVFERPAPAPDLLRRLWLLLPTSTRCQLWPATFAFGNALGFDVLVVPRADFEQYAPYVREEQAGDYPEGRYELGLQAAAEAGDQGQLDALFARRSSSQTLRLALILLAVVIVLEVVTNILNPPPAARPPPPSPSPSPPLPAPTASAKPAPAILMTAEEPPSFADFDAPLSEDMEKRLVAALRGLCRMLSAEPLEETAAVDELLDALHERLRVPGVAGDSRRRDAVEQLREEGMLGHPEQQLRALLWQFGIKEYDDQRLNPVELVELLQRKLVP